MGSVAARVGANVRRLRRQRGLTLAELGRATNLAKGTLAAIEQGRGNPTVETLNALSRGLRATLGDLVADIGPTSTKVVREADALLVDIENLEARLLSRSSSTGIVLELYWLRLAAGGRQNSSSHAPGVREELLVTGGQFRVGPEGDLVELAPGDYASYAADVPHCYEAVGSQPAVGVLLMRFPTPGLVGEVFGDEIVGSADGD